MTKRRLIPLMFFLTLIFLSSNAFSLSWSDLYTESYYTPFVDYDYTGASSTAIANGLGTYIGTADQNGDVGQATLEAFFASGGYAVDTVSGLNVYTTQTISGELTAGWWQSPVHTPPDTRDYVDFIVVKGSNSLSVHQWVPPVFEGLWNIAYLANAGGSGSPPSMSFVRGYSASQTPIPEPASIFLLGIGLSGLAVVSRKKFLKKS